MIRLAKELIETRLVDKQSVTCNARKILSYLVSNKSALKIWSSFCRETGKLPKVKGGIM